jgi:predicted peptidase
MRNAFVILTTLATTFFMSASVRADEAKQQAVKLDAKVPVELDYLLYLPKGYADQEKWPLLVFLHGAGERGSDLNLVKKHGPPKLIEEGKDMPFIVVSPQCPSGQWWTAKPLELTALLDEVCAKHKVDKDRVYLTGLSMGGFGTWTLAAYSPDRFAAIAPICGGGEVLATRALGHMPTWVFHGAKDPVVPLKRSEDMVEALKRVNKEVKFTVYPEAQHDSWTETYNNPELYAWLLEHKRAAPESAGP